MAAARAGQIVHGQLARAAPQLASADLEPAQSPVEMAELRQVKVLPVVLGVFLALLAVGASAMRWSPWSSAVSRTWPSCGSWA